MSHTLVNVEVMSSVNDFVLPSNLQSLYLVVRVHLPDRYSNVYNLLNVSQNYVRSLLNLKLVPPCEHEKVNPIVNLRDEYVSHVKHVVIQILHLR